MMKKILLCLAILTLSACVSGGVFGGSNGIGTNFGLGTGFSF